MIVFFSIRKADDHGNLAGLGDDDHPQYLTQARGDALYSPIGGGGGTQFISSPVVSTLNDSRGSAGAFSVDTANKRTFFKTNTNPHTWIVFNHADALS